MDVKVQVKLQELFKNYSKNLPKKIQAIEVQWQNLLQNWSMERFKAFHREVHSLCGSSGTYGYMELSKAAREMEIYLKTLLTTTSLSTLEIKTISDFIEKLRLVHTQPSTNHSTHFTAEPVNEAENKLVYILEKDERLNDEISDSLQHVGYATKAIADIESLKQAMNENAAIAVIIDTDFLQEGSGELVELQNQQASPFQIFCIVPDAALLPRLEAIRAGCNAFFQKPVDIFYLTQTLNQKCIITRESFRILIVDDSEPLAEYYSLILTQAGMITHAISNPMKFLEALESFQPDLLLMDIYMPECTGLELAAVLRQEKRYTKIPIIFLSTEDDKRKQLFALSLGGDDFLTKPVSPQHLISAVRSRSKRANVLNYYMKTDSLTGLLNHSSILKRLEIELENAKLNKTKLSFVMLDIDYFKRINDSYGHPLGDMVIKKLATLLLIRLRSQDLVGRYGGEEFAIILSGTTADDSKVICDDLRKQFEQYCFTVDKTHFYATFSAGISSIATAETANSIIEQADKALYEAKQQGRNQVVVYSPAKP